MKNVLVGFFLIVFCICATAKDISIPQDLLAFVTQSNCAPIPDFYDRPSMVDPSYVYGYLPGEKEDTAVVWCKPNTSENTYTYWLLFFTKTDDISIGCPKKIVWDAYPGGLSIEKDNKVSLDDFYSVTDRKHKAPKGAMTNGPVIVNYYDGNETFFYCYQNQWLFRQRS